MKQRLSTLFSTLMGGARGGLLLLALVATTALWAHDFVVNGIYYNFLDDKTNEVAVTYRGSSYNEYADEYSGSVIIPSTVTYNGTTYSVTSIGDLAFYKCSSLSSVIIPNSVTEIGGDAFAGCSGLTSITIPNSVTSIGNNAFRACSSLTSITIPNSVTSIGYEAFYLCYGLTSPVYNAHCFAYLPTSYQGAYTIPEGIEQIAGGAFSSCSSLTSITIPNSVTSIGDRAFDGCKGLTSPVYNAHCFAYLPTSYQGAYTIPEGIKQIAGGAFSSCSSLTSITIPNSVTSIGNYAFCGCSSLTSITIPNSVTEIGSSAFYGCSSLTSITIPNSVTSIGSSAFYGCSSLTSITIPNSVTSIESSVFYNCSGLTSIIVEDANSKYDSRDNCNAIIETATNTLIAGCQNTIIPNSVRSIGGGAFYGCSSLTSITIPNSVTSIRGGAFVNCSSLTSITLGKNLMGIGSSAFRDCSGLTSITIPNSVVIIEDYAFNGCSSLTSITSLAEIPPTLGTGVFNRVSKDIPVYVCSVSTYQSAEGWKDFTNIQEPLVEYSIAVGVNDSIMGTAMVDYNTYCEGAQITATPNNGYRFTHWNDGNTDNPRVVQVTEDQTYTAYFAEMGPVETVYFVNAHKWTGTINAYAWTSTPNAEWPGAPAKKEATQIGGYDVYSYTAEAGTYASIIFNNGSAQTPDLKWTAGKYYVKDGWYTKEEAAKKLAAPVEYESVYFVNVAGWETVKIYTWNPSIAGWPGVDTKKEANKLGGYDVYSYSVEKGSSFGGMLFTCGGDECKTGDLQWTPGKYFVKGKWYTKEEAEAQLAVYVYIVAGAAALLGSEWNNADVNNQMTKQADGSYQLVKSDLTLAAGTYEYKVVLNYDWNTCYPGENAKLEIATDGTYDVTFKFVPSTSEVSAKAEAKSPVETHVLTILSNDNAMGSVSGSGSYNKGKNVTISATANDGYHFSHWNDGNTDNPRVVQVTEDQTYTAYFAEDLHTVTVVANNSGGGFTQGSGTYKYGTYTEIAATPNNGYRFTHWNDGNTDNPRVVQVTEDQTYTAYFVAANLADGLKVEDYSYPTRAGKYNLSNNWVSSMAEGNFIAPGTEGMVRGMAMKDGVMYFINRELRALVPVDAATGQMGEPIFITGEHLFETETEVEGVMQWGSTVTLPFNDVKVDNAGNVLVGACITNAQTFFVYKVDVKTGEATEVIKERLYDNTDLFPTGSENYRFDAFGVYGDVDGNACIMAANGKGMDVYRWIIKDGVADKAERILIQLDPEYDKSYNINATSLVTPPQIYPQDETGSAFYVDGKDLYPMLIDEDGLLVEDMIHIPTGLAVVNNEGDTLYIDGAMNGLIEFQVGDEYFFLMAASNFNKSIPATFALFKFADAKRQFAGAEPLWYFPAKGFGDGNTKNGIFTSVPSVHVEGNKATIYLYSAYLGYAVYTLTIGEEVPVETHTLTVLSNDNAMGSVSGSGTYKQGQSVTISATANNGYRFTHWNDGNTDNPRVVQVTEDQTYTAYFAEDLYTVTVVANNSEAGFTQGSGTYKYGTYIEIAATPNNGYHFSHWNDGETTNPRVIQVTSDMTYTAYFYKNTYTVSVDYNSAYGTVAGPTSGEYLDEITLTATPNLGYVFVKWSDGVTTNPRTIVLTKDMTLSAHFAQAYSGQCGNDLYWKYDPDAQTIAITGSGEMYHYTASTQPWILFKEQIRKVEISNEATSLGTSAFEGCRSLGEVHIGLNLLDIYENAFAACKRLYHIYSYPTYPPFADVTSFANYSADLHIPYEAKELYVRDEVWGLFNILYLGAETEDVPSGEVTTTTTSTSVTITWPTDENADSYTIEIKRGDQVFCTLTFSKDGQLTNIAFAPSRDGQHRAQYAELTANGLRFTVTNLNSGTQYSYDVTTKDENDEVIESYSGEFTTQSDVTTDNGYGVSDNGYGAWNIRKEFRNGQLIILRDGVEYNAQGQIIKE